jgi:hypothetical protein
MTAFGWTRDGTAGGRTPDLAFRPGYIQPRPQQLLTQQ